MTTKVQADAHLDHDEPDELIVEKCRTLLIESERWELTDLGLQHQQERRDHDEPDEPDELTVEKCRTLLIESERWELTDLGLQHQQERRQCIEGDPVYQPIDVDCIRCGATAGNICQSKYKGRLLPFVPLHSTRHKLAAVAHRECPVSACAAGVGQPCVKVTGPDAERGTPQRAVHFRREHGEDAPWGSEA